jgi:hypothetical protein
VLRQHGADLRLGHVLADPVAAQEEAIAVGERHDERRHLALLADPERVRQHAAEPRALARDVDVDPRREQAREQRVVLGELHRDAVAHEVRARVARVGEHKLAADRDRADERRAHARLRLVGGALGEDQIVRGDHARADRAEQLLLGVGRALREPGVGEPAHPVVEPLRADRLHRERARDLARRVAAHPVAHDEQPRVGVEEVSVLVVVAHLPDVRDCSADDRGSHGHPITLHYPRSLYPTLRTVSMMDPASPSLLRTRRTWMSTVRVPPA